MNASRPVGEATVEELYQKACEMARKKKSRLRVTGACTGTLRTEWTHRSIGTLSGVEFIAEVSDEKGDLVVTFVVHSFELEKPLWVAHDSIDEAEAFNAKLEVAELKKSGKKLN